MIAGCGGSQPFAPQRVPLAHRQTASGDLVYAASLLYVTIATYPDLKPTARFRFYSDTAMLCSDLAGNVFAVTFGQIPAYAYKYPHGATTPSAKLRVPQPFDASSCSVDPATKDLAVGLALNTYSSGAGVAVYRHERGKPEIYTDSQLSWAKLVAYDDSGDLFVLGLPPQHYGYGGQPILLELAKGSRTFTTINGLPPYDLTYINGMQWDGQYIDLQYSWSIAQFALNVRGSIGQVANWIQLNPPGGVRETAPGAMWLDRQNLQIVTSAHRRRSLAIFAYPQGGNAIKVTGLLHDGRFNSVTVSAAR